VAARVSTLSENGTPWTTFALAKSSFVSSWKGGSSRNTWPWSVRKASPSAPQRIRLDVLPKTFATANGAPTWLKLA
jgi:hypothetical protein